MREQLTDEFGNVPGEEARDQAEIGAEQLQRDLRHRRRCLQGSHAHAHAHRARRRQGQLKHALGTAPNARSALEAVDDERVQRRRFKLSDAQDDAHAADGRRRPGLARLPALVVMQRD